MLTINNIYKSFYHRSILEDLSFNVNQGDTIALLGRNGIGKSTLLRILGKISQPDKGNILYNNSNFNLDPPIKNPSTPSTSINSFAFSGFTDPP